MEIIRIKLGKFSIKIEPSLYQIISDDNSYLNISNSRFKVVIGNNNIITADNILVIGENNEIRGNKVVCIGSFTHNSCKEQLILLTPTVSCCIRKLNELCYNVISSKLSRNEMLKYKDFLMMRVENISVRNISSGNIDHSCNLDHPCVICYNNNVNVALSCGHARYCNLCIKNIMKRGRRCPECRERIKSILRIYL